MSLEKTIQTFIKEGKEAEMLFATTAAKQGFEVIKSSRLADLHEHWDYLLKKDNKKVRVEVKGLKRFSRKDENYMVDYTWVELHGVGKNNQGWLWGKADIIAFETAHNSFILVPIEDLRTLLMKKMRREGRQYSLSNPAEMAYKQYSRGLDRHDIIVCVPLEDIYRIKSVEWKKM